MDIDCNLSDMEIDFSIDDAINFNLEIDEKLLKIMRKISEAYTYNEYRKIIEISKEFEKVNNNELDLINKKIDILIGNYPDLIKQIINENK